jgi:hypothetical protein
VPAAAAASADRAAARMPLLPGAREMER